MLSVSETSLGRVVCCGVNITVNKVRRFCLSRRSFGKPQDDRPVIARPFTGRGNPEDWCANDYTSRSAFYCGDCRSRLAPSQ